MNEEAIILHPSRIYLNDRCSLYVKRMYHAHELNLKSGDSHTRLWNVFVQMPNISCDFYIIISIDYEILRKFVQ